MDFSDVLVFASNAHGSTMRKNGSEPYVMHPIRVAATLRAYDMPDAAVYAGLLHDVVEDTDIPLADIRKAFGDEVADIVDLVTEPPGKPVDPGAWFGKKVAYIQRAVSSPMSFAVMMADKLDNANSVIDDYESGGNIVWRFRHPLLTVPYYAVIASFVAGTMPPNLPRHVELGSALIPALGKASHLMLRGLSTPPVKTRAH